MTQLLDSPPANGGLAKRQTVMGSLAERYGMDPNKLFDTIKATCIKGGNATNEQVQAFLIVANQYKLDPFLKEIYAFPAKGGGIVPIVSIDGWSKIANATGLLDGFEFTLEGEGKGMSCTCTLHVKGRQFPARVTEYMEECYRSTEPWNQWPRRMLRHKAWIQCVRVAFGFGGIHDEDEARDIVAADGTPVIPAGGKRPFGPQVVAHPTDENRTIDTADGNLPDADQAERIINNAPRATEPQQHSDPDVSGSDVESPADALPDLSTYERFYAALGEWAAENNVDGFDALVAKVKLDNKVERTTAAGTHERQRVYAAAIAGRLGPDGRVKE